MDNITLIYFFVGAAIVLAFAVNYFNQPGYKFADEDRSAGLDQEDLMLEPALPKHLTDRFEYTIYLVAYILVTEVIYILLALFLPDIINAKDAGKPAGTFALTRENIVLAALIITGIAPNLPYIRQLLERSKIYLHYKAQIPKKGRDVYLQIKSYQPHYTRAEISNILRDERYVRCSDTETLRPDLNESDFKMAAWTLEGRWAKLSYLISYINRWSKISPFRSYIGNRELQYSSIQQAYDHLQKKMTQLRKEILSESEGAGLNGLVEATLHRSYRLISCLLYLAGKTDAAVDQFLDQLGYAPSERKDFPISWNNLIYMIGSIVISIIFGGLLIFVVVQLKLIPLVVDISTGNLIRWTAYALPLISIPVLWVLFIKRYVSSHSEAWPVITENTRYKKLSDRPWQIYFIVAVTAYFIGGIVLFVTSIIVRAINAGTIHNITGLMFRSILVWSAIVFVTASFAAYRLDSAPNLERSKLSNMGILLLGAFFQGISTTLVMFLAFMHEFATNLNPLLLPDPDRGKLGVYCLIGFLLGFMLYLSFGFGSLRQRRQFWRRKVKRPVYLHSGAEKITGVTVNVSEEGAMIESDEYLPDGSTTIKLIDKEGHSIPGRIVKVRGNFLHIQFPDVSAWGLMQNSLDIPVPA